MNNDEVHKYTSEINESKDSDYIVLVWHIEDVRSRELQLSKSKDSKLTDSQCREILKAAKANHDCNFGITWESFDTYINDYFDWCITRPVDGVSYSNNREYLLDDDGKIQTFPVYELATEFLSENFISLKDVWIETYYGGVKDANTK